MQTNKKKEYALVLFFVVVISTTAFFISKDRAQLETIVPQEQLVLEETDFRVNSGNSILLVGTSTRDEAIKVFPQGKTLGMSTIYKPDNIDCLLTFDEDEKFLQKLHLNSQEIQTYRGIKVGDPFTLVVEKYGPNYSSVGHPGKSSDFDAVYGVGNNIIFQVREDKVKTIILQKE
ncbi:MAG: hypothetical protein PHC92_06455 [Syntrophomonadaceae bacterium]|nr:hypothetical protein [Syntrophomonadaceae bacterium]MDD3022642.1 hypothetical protein [Syntrophomonadaceae bacterium]